MAVPLTCPDVGTLERLVLGQLPPDEIASLQEHLAHCPHCLKCVNDLATDDPLLQAMKTPPAAGPEEAAVERLMERLRCGGPSLPDTVVMDTIAWDPAASDTPAASRPESYYFLTDSHAPGELGRLGAYRVLGVLGSGGMGTVFEAEDSLLQRPVALKLMKPSIARHAEAKQRFLREARAAAQIQHDHIVTIHQVGEDRGIPFLAMQLLRGETLERRLQSCGRLPATEVVRIGREVARGLAAAHARGLIHRDIKPGNIWLEDKPEGGSIRQDEGKDEVGRMKDESERYSNSSFIPHPSSFRIKILDFGLARAAAETTQSSQSGVIAGTPAYMAPEQASDASIDHRCDLFSLGCVLYRACTGELPFKGVKPLTILWSLAVTQPPPPRRINPDVPQALSDLIEKLLAKNPADRPQTAREVSEALRAIDADLARPQQQARHPRRRVGPVAAAVFTTLLATLGVVYAPAVYRLVTNQGQIVVESDNPDVKVVVKQGQQQIAIIDPKTDREITLKAGDYQVEMVPEKLGLGLSAKEFALTRGGKQVVRVRWEPASPIQVMVCPEFVTSALFCLDGSHVITAGGNRRDNGKWELGSDFALRLWDIKKGRQIRPFRDHVQIVRALAVSGNGKRAVSAGGENQKSARDWMLRLWDLETGRLIRRFDDKHNDVVSGVAFSPDGKRVVSACRDKSLRLWDPETGREIRCLDEGKTIYWNVDISRDGKLVLSNSNDGKLRLWDADTGTVLRSLDASKDWNPVRLSPDGRFALTPGRSADGRSIVELWDLENEALVRRFGHESGWACASQFSADGNRFLTYGSDGTVRLRDVNGKELRRFLPEEVPEESLKIVSSAALSPDGRFAVSSTWDGTVRIWKLWE